MTWTNFGNTKPTLCIVPHLLLYEYVCVGLYMDSSSNFYLSDIHIADIYIHVSNISTVKQLNLIT